MKNIGLRLSSHINWFRTTGYRSAQRFSGFAATGIDHQDFAKNNVTIQRSQTQWTDRAGRGHLAPFETLHVRPSRFQKPGRSV